ncbi:MAG: GNAT family N-acetyltransferase [Trueperaceae bacterium]
MLPQSGSVLATERLVLRPFVEQDLEALAELHGDERVMRYVTGAPVSRAEVEREVLPRFVRRDQCRPAFGALAAFERESGEFVGWFALTRPPGRGNTEAALGFRLKPEFWGQGLATEGASAVLEHGFRHGVRKVRATTYELNLGSQKVLEKLGMRLVRRYRPTVQDLAGGAFVDPAASEVWDGDEFEYELSSAAWRDQAGTA